MKTYADAFAHLARKEGGYEKSLKEATERGDKLGIATATRMLQRVGAAKEELFAHQESTKSDEPEIMPNADNFGPGGTTPPTGISPFLLPAAKNPYSFDPFDNLPTLGGLSLSPMAVKAAPASIWNTPTKAPTLGALDDRLPKGAKAAAQAGVNATSFWDKAKPYAPYAPQILGDVIGLTQLGALQAPVDMSGLAAPTLDTTINTDAAEGAVASQDQAFRQGIRSNSLTSSAEMAQELASRTAAGKSRAGILQDKMNRQTELRNQQAQLNAGVANQNAEIHFQNANRQTDFQNEKINARLGLINGIGQKVTGMFTDFAQQKRERDYLNLISKAFTPGLLGNVMPH